MIAGLTIAAALLLGVATAGQHSEGHDMSSMTKGMGPAASVQPTMPASSTTAMHEGGQAAFTAIAESTAALESDPLTDWSKVNIDALRRHLVDMDNVTIRSDVARKDIPLGERFEITSADPNVRESIERMVRLHSSMANKEGPYHFGVDAIPAGAGLSVTGPTAADQAKIRGLGFFGLLAHGVHHQLHHLMLAKGQAMQH